MRHFAILLCLAASTSCGYTLRNSSTNPLRRDGVERVYVAPVVNNSYKPGVENLIYNQLVRTIGALGVVQLVDRQEKADAILSSTVNDAGYVASSTTPLTNLFPAPQIPGFSFGGADPNISVATEYMARLTCSFSLTATRPGPKGAPQGRTVWNGAFGRTRGFPGNNQLGALGTTSALINESEFDRALRDLAQSIAGDMHEAMMAKF